MMKRLKWIVTALASFLSLYVASPVLAQAEPEIVGTWHGTLTTPSGSVILVLYVTEGEDAALKAQVESANQAPGQMADVTTITAADGHLSWKIDRIGATFEGDWVAAEQAWQGTFNQGLDLPLKFSKGLPPPLPVIEGLDGRWEGTAQLNNAKLRQVLRVTTGERGTVILYDSPDQMANGAPVENFTREGQAVSFAIMNGLSTFTGTLSDDKTQLVGKFTTTVNDNVAEVTLTRMGAGTPRAPPGRPQTPKEPFPYTVEEVTFDNPQWPDVHLAGSLTLPEGDGPFPAAVMITGSGGQNRDEALMGHRPFAVIADYLTRNGIAVLRFDDRGIGQSKSATPYESATSADLATDANAAFAYLRTRSEIDPDAIGFIGHSEGGMIAPIAMSDNPDAAYAVLLAGPGTGLVQLMNSQQRLILTTMGASQQQIDDREPMMRAMFTAIANAANFEEGREAAKAVLTPEALAKLGAPADFNKDLIVGQISTPWFAYFLRYDPVPALAAIKVPLLALNGSLDLQVPADENLPAIAEATRDNPDVTIVKLDGLNHLFQHAVTGGVGEYSQIEETFAPEALDRMTQWILERFAKH